MDLFELRNEAVRIAQTYAPAPKMEPFIAGISGAVIASLVITVFLSLAGLDSANFGQAISITMALGFAGTWWYVRRQHDRHNAAVDKELSSVTRNNTDEYIRNI